MSENGTQSEALAGKLILAIQKQWGAEAGEPESAESEAIMHKSHRLLQAAKTGTLVALLGNASVTEFLGASWFARNQHVLPHARALLESIGRSGEA